MRPVPQRCGRRHRVCRVRRGVRWARGGSVAARVRDDTARGWLRAQRARARLPSTAARISGPAEQQPHTGSLARRLRAARGRGGVRAPCSSESKPQAFPSSHPAHLAVDESGLVTVAPQRQHAPPAPDSARLRAATTSPPRPAERRRHPVDSRRVLRGGLRCMVSVASTVWTDRGRTAALWSGRRNVRTDGDGRRCASTIYEWRISTVDPFEFTAVRVCG